MRKDSFYEGCGSNVAPPKGKSGRCKKAYRARNEHREPHVFAHVYPHALRHTFASLCYAAKMQPKTVQMLMGHANYSTTIDIYTHIGEDFKQEDIDKFNSLVLNDDAGKTVHEMISFM